jgi:hypothetical protein
MLRKLGLVVALLCTGVATKATVVEATKTITWSFDALPGPALQGEYGWDLFARAIDDHGFPLGHSQDDRNWLVLNGFAKVTAPPAKAGGPLGVEPFALTEADFSAQPPVLQGGKFLVKGVIHAKATASVVPDPGGKIHGIRQDAEALGSMGMRIPGVAVTGLEIDGHDGVIRVEVVLPNNDTVILKIDSKNKTFSDPISISLADLTDGTLITEDLFAIRAEGDMSGGWSWDENGITLNVPSDGVSSASITLDVLSSWITDPGIVASTVSLSDGVFTATGMFSGLPWIVTPTSATLHGGIFDSITLPYRIPSALINPSHLYRPSLLFNVGISAHEAVSVPEPGLLSLVSALLISKVCYIFKRHK